MSDQPQIPVFGVSEFLAILNQTLEFAYPTVVVEGEIAEFRIAKQKWVHFLIKDDESRLKCFMTVYQLKTELEEGMKVRITAQPRMTKWGAFSMNVKKVELVGEGALRRAFELLKKKLTKEGLFAEERKKALPKYPKHIGVISSMEAAGYRDFIKITNDRWGGLNIDVADVQVQGAPAPEQIVAAIRHFNEAAKQPDVLVLTRGGGSIEDLQAFNEESVARAVAGSGIPVLVGVGHEQDITLAGLAADKRASTPSNAAELLVPDRRDFIRYIQQQQTSMSQELTSIINQSKSNVFNSLLKIERQLSLPGERVRRYEARLLEKQGQIIQRHKSKLVELYRALKGYNPETALRHGYALIRGVNDQIIKSVAEVAIGDTLMVQLHKGKIKTEVKDVQKS